MPAPLDESLARLSRLGLTAGRGLAAKFGLIASVPTLLIGLGWVGMSSVFSGAFTWSTVPATAWIVAAVGVVSTVGAAYLFTTAGRGFARVLEARRLEIATVRIARLEPLGSKMSVFSRISLSDAAGKDLTWMELKAPRHAREAVELVKVVCPDVQVIGADAV